jgi:hypothetical protein
MEKSSGFKSNGHSGKCPGVQNPPCSLLRTPGGSWQCGLELNPSGRHNFGRIFPLNSGDHMPSQKLLIDIGFDPSASGGKKNNEAFLAIAGELHLLQESLGKGSNSDVRVHLGHRNGDK